MTAALALAPEGGGGAARTPSVVGTARRARRAAATLARSLAGNGRLLLCCAGWYACSSVTSTLNKAILTEFPRPLTVTLISFCMTVLVGLVFGALLPFTKPQRPTARLVRVILPYSACRVVSHAAASMALALMPVSLMHTVKAISPLFTVALSRVFLGTRISREVLLAVVPICGGIMLACANDVEFQPAGALAASFSVLVLAFQAILSKSIFSISDLTEFSLLFYSSLASAVLMTPVWLVTEASSLFVQALAARPDGDAAGVTATAAAAAAAVGLGPRVLGYLFFAGVAQYLHGIFAYTVVAEASALTYSVASVVKRVVVIAVSILWLGNSISALSMAGAAITFAGLLYYNEAVRRSASAAGQQRRSPPLVRGPALRPLLPTFAASTSSRDADRALGLAHRHPTVHDEDGPSSGSPGSPSAGFKLASIDLDLNDLTAVDSGLELADHRYLV